MYIKSNMEISRPARWSYWEKEITAQEYNIIDKAMKSPLCPPSEAPVDSRFFIPSSSFQAQSEMAWRTLKNGEEEKRS